MKNNNNAIKILDCTLRDGGYLNTWDFGEENISGVVELLYKTGIDYIECGFYNPNSSHTADRTIFSCLRRIRELAAGMDESFFTLMLNYEDAEYIELKDFKNFALRLAFKKHHLDGIKPLCEKLKNNSARIFLNPMHTSTYTQNELEKLLDIVNFISPECLTVVDTMGIMDENDTENMFFCLDKFINPETALGFHSHNNLNMSFMNIQKLIKLDLKREIIIDSCISGIGRGAGILPTETITKYLNDVFNKDYKTKHLRECADKYLYSLKEEFINDDKYPYYLSALNKCHPFYAKCLKEKMNLSYEEMNLILSNIPDENKTVYDDKVLNSLLVRESLLLHK